jgi:hypothetical protein
MIPDLAPGEQAKVVEVGLADLRTVRSSRALTLNPSTLAIDTQADHGFRTSALAGTGWELIGRTGMSLNLSRIHTAALQALHVGGPCRRRAGHAGRSSSCAWSRPC